MYQQFNVALTPSQCVQRSADTGTLSKVHAGLLVQTRAIKTPTTLTPAIARVHMTCARAAACMRQRRDLASQGQGRASSAELQLFQA